MKKFRNKAKNGDKTTRVTNTRQEVVGAVEPRGEWQRTSGVSVSRVTRVIETRR